MEIVPGRGVPAVQLAEDRALVARRLGVPTSAQPDSDFYTERDPSLVLRYSTAGAVDLIEIPYSGSGHEVTLNGIQLTFRPIHEVVEDLRAAGFIGRTSDVGFDFPEGFAIWSMGSLTLRDIGVPAAEEEGLLVVEGVSVGDPAYFGF